jgi:hypothetical protein
MASRKRKRSDIISSQKKVKHNGCVRSSEKDELNEFHRQVTLSWCDRTGKIFMLPGKNIDDVKLYECPKRIIAAEEDKQTFEKMESTFAKLGIAYHMTKMINIVWDSILLDGVKNISSLWLDGNSSTYSIDDLVMIMSIVELAKKHPVVISYNRAYRDKGGLTVSEFTKIISKTIQLALPKGFNYKVLVNLTYQNMHFMCVVVARDTMVFDNVQIPQIGTSHLDNS